MTDAQRAAQEVLEYLRSSGHIDDLGYIYTEGLDPKIAEVDIKRIIDKHMC